MFASKTSWRLLQDRSSRRLQDISSRCLEDVFSVKIFCLPRRLEDFFKTSSRCFARGLVNVFKTSSRHLGRGKTVTLKTYWRRLQDVLDGVKLFRWRRLEDHQMFVGLWLYLTLGTAKVPYVYLNHEYACVIFSPNLSIRPTQLTTSSSVSYFLGQKNVFTCYMLKEIG